MKALVTVVHAPCRNTNLALNSFVEGFTKVADLAVHAKGVLRVFAAGYYTAVISFD